MKTKKPLLLLITLTTFANVSYASFPVSDTLKMKQDTLQTETVEQYHIRMQEMGFDIENCRCNDCKKFKGINTVLKNGETRKKQTTNIWPLVKLLGVWVFAIGAILVIWLLIAIFNAFKAFGEGPVVG
jgi:hypothetical protein